MNCYQHQSNPAVGICKNCAKAVCPSCAIESAAGIVCSPACKTTAEQLDQMNRRALRIYGIGDKKPAAIPPGALMWLAFGVVFLATGIWDLYRNQGSLDTAPLPLAMGTIFMALGIWAWRRQRELQINC